MNQLGGLCVQDLSHALEVVDKAMKECIQKMSSFEQYKSEVQSGNLEWSPMHKDAVFWRENVSKFEENNYQVPILVDFHTSISVCYYFHWLLYIHINNFFPLVVHPWR
jgi:hypothetical protein